MKTIDELLDELQGYCYQEGWGAGEWVEEVNEARAAVDAEIKRMQDRIAELEADKKKSIDILMKQAMATKSQDDIPLSAEFMEMFNSQPKAR